MIHTYLINNKCLHIPSLEQSAVRGIIQASNNYIRYNYIRYDQVQIGIHHQGTIDNGDIFEVYGLMYLYRCASREA